MLWNVSLIKPLLHTRKIKYHIIKEKEKFNERKTATEQDIKQRSVNQMFSNWVPVACFPSMYTITLYNFFRKLSVYLTFLFILLCHSDSSQILTEGYIPSRFLLKCRLLLTFLISHYFFPPNNSFCSQSFRSRKFYESVRC